MKKHQKVKYKTEDEITNEWDNISYIRYHQISDKRDLSFEYIMKPYFLDVLKDYNTQRIVDIGCGTGNLTFELSSLSDNCTGIDLSQESINIAQKFFAKESNNINFVNKSIEDFASNYDSSPFTVAIANMTFMDVMELDKAIASIRSILTDDASLIFSITHPYFWPKYSGYENEEWFNYKNETIVETNFQISLEDSGIKTTHIHRPIESYINSLINNGFLIEKVAEPVPSETVTEMYPKKVDYPRFMFIHAKVN